MTSSPLLELLLILISLLATVASQPGAPSRWAKISLCTDDLTEAAVSVIPLDVCTSSGYKPLHYYCILNDCYICSEDNYHGYVLTTSLFALRILDGYSIMASANQTVYTYRWYDDRNCTKLYDNDGLPTHTHTQSLSCASAPSASRYALEVLDRFPAPGRPKLGYLETWYLSDDCSGGISGWTWYKLHTCLNDLNKTIFYNLNPGTDFMLNGTVFTTFAEKNGSCVTETKSFLLAANDTCTSLEHDYTHSLADVGPGDSYKVSIIEALPMSSTPACFAGDELITLESGQRIPIRTATVGDMILVADEAFRLSYSRIIAIPHEENSILSQFISVKTVSGETIRMTLDHIIPSGPCLSPKRLPLVSVAEVTIGSCLQSIYGRQKVVSIDMVSGLGVYTVVTSKAYLVVNNIIASPFAISHAIGTSFYSFVHSIGLLELHRKLSYQLWSVLLFLVWAFSTSSCLTDEDNKNVCSPAGRPGRNVLLAD
jgi:hypothetical protein